ncbi:Zn(II)2Cys6 transcription factor [Aspergillus stella-maris]|uniref:Zn(II)2Cys6 transcription factor n=1 Tax=Aspergillus stella-maris TaxID=1810926 RepID=UPI003CCD86F7
MSSLASEMPFDLGQLSSADRTQSLKRPRPRPVISCLRCREKKLKCDRVTPCENCRKAGCVSTCEYRDGQGSEKRTRLEPGLATAVHPFRVMSGTDSDVIEDLQRRLKRVEELLAIRSESIGLTSIETEQNGVARSEEGTREEQVAPSTGSRPQQILAAGAAIEAGTPPAPSFSARPDPGTLVVKGTRTRYHGPTSRMTILEEFEGAKDAVAECDNDSAIFRLAKEVQFLQTKTRIPPRVPSISHSATIIEPENLRQCIPEREVCDHLVDLYIANHEQIFRVLHIPTFRRQYNEFWTMNQSSDQAAAFIAQLIPVLAAAIPFADHRFRDVNQEMVALLRRSAIDLVWTWLQQLPRKQHIELSTLQIETLILIARWTWSEPADELWRESGSLLRSGMVMGLHVDPSTCPDLSVFQAEMRRRLWTTIVEMDLQASAALGMPIDIPHLDPRSLVSANINDIDFDETSTEPSAVRLEGRWTDSIAQVTLASSLLARVRAMTVPNDDVTIIEQLSQQLERTIQRIPYCLKVSTNIPCTNSRPSTFGLVLLDLCLCRPFNHLCRAVFKQTNHDHENFSTILERLVDSSYTVLKNQHLFDPNAIEAMTWPTPEICKLFYSLTKGDILQAALDMCKYLSLIPRPSAMVLGRRSVAQEVESTVQTLVRNMDKPGSDMKDIILLKVALRSSQLRDSNSPTYKRQQMKKAIRDVLTDCRHHLVTTFGGYIGRQTPVDDPQDAAWALSNTLEGADIVDPSLPLDAVRGLWRNDPSLAADFSTFMADCAWPSDGDADDEFFRLFVEA